MGKLSLIFDIIANDKAKSTVKGIGDEVDAQRSKWDKWKGTATVASAAAGAAIVKFGADSIAAYSESEEAQKSLAFAFEKFPALADTNQAALQQLNSELQKKTKYDDDNIASGQAVLAQFKLTGSQITDVTPLLLDYADKMGKDIPSAAQDVGKALLGNAKALKSIGISYKSTGDSATDYTNITALMREKVGGFAENEGKTAAGQAAILKNQFGELEETAGSKLLPTLTKLTAAGLATVTWIQNNGPLAAGLATTLGVLAIATGVAANWTSILAVAHAAHAVAAGIGTAATWAFNAAVAVMTSPITLVVVAVAALVAGIVWLATKTTFFQDAWAATWSAVSSFAGTVGARLSGVFTGIGSVMKTVFGWTPLGLIVNNWSTIIGFFTGIPGRIGGAFSSLGSVMMAAFKFPFNTVIGLWNRSLGSIRFSVPSWVPGLGGKAIAFPQIPYLARGGVVDRATLMVAGEAGTEAVLPFDRATEFADMVAASLNPRPSAGAPQEVVTVVNLDGREIYRVVKKHAAAEAER